MDSGKHKFGLIWHTNRKKNHIKVTLVINFSHHLEGKNFMKIANGKTYCSANNEKVFSYLWKNSVTWYS